MWLTLLWNYKAWILAGVVAVAAIAYISYIKIDNNLMTAKVTSQKSQIEALERNNQILEQNAVAIKKQDERLQAIQQTSNRVQKMVAALPRETTEVLRTDENITMLNDCLVDYANTGVLPETCSAVKAYLPQGNTPDKVEGRGEPAK
jgi:cell division protein FtsB